MRIAVVSDVHGSLTPLEAVIADIERRAPDEVVLAGDYALMGPQPAEVVDRLRGLGWPAVVGNVDELLWRPELRAERLDRAPKLAALTEAMFDEYAPFTRELLGDERVEWLRSLPATHRVDDVFVTHARPGDLWRAPMPDADDGDMRETYGDCGARVVAYGHIHRPFVRTLGDDLTVCNTGSVGLPWDGDPRAAYLLVDDSRAEVVRVAYDVEREASLLESSGHPHARRFAEMRRRAEPLPVESWSDR